MRANSYTLGGTIVASAALFCPVPPSPASQQPEAIPPALEEAVQMVFSGYRVTAQYHYVMTGKVRLLLFWIGKDDVGDGYVGLGRGSERPELEMIRLRVGSDPAKAPRRINRWGAGTEVLERDLASGVPRSSAFFGFMKTAEGTSVRAVERELESEQQKQQYPFEASINRVEPTAVRASILPMLSRVDLDIGKMDEAEHMVLDQYADAFSSSRYLELHGDGRGGCDSNVGFLFTLKEITEAALSGQEAPIASCYLYNTRHYTMTLSQVTRIDERGISYGLDGGEEVERSYRDLLDLRFEVRKRLTGKRSKFSLLLGTSGELRGVPVQMTYQPNWWFKAILNLHTATGPRFP